MNDLLNSLMTIDLLRLGSTLTLVILAAVISRWQRLALEGQMLVAVARAFIQLIAIGYVLALVFETDSPFFILLIVGVMITIAGITSGQRGAGIPRATAVALASIAISAGLTLGLLVVLDVFTFTPQNIIPIAGMVVGNSMNACSLVMVRLHDEFKAQRAQIEAALALGASARQAAMPHIRRALIAGMTPIIDGTKTVGLIQLPGAMTGMILAGAPPLDAVQLQIIVMYMMMGAVAYAAMAATFFTYRQFFTRAHQLAFAE